MSTYLKIIPIILFFDFIGTAVKIPSSPKIVLVLFDTTFLPPIACLNKGTLAICFFPPLYRYNSPFGKAMPKLKFLLLSEYFVLNSAISFLSIEFVFLPIISAITDKSEISCLTQIFIISELCFVSIKSCSCKSCSYVLWSKNEYLEKDIII